MYSCIHVISVPDLVFDSFIQYLTNYYIQKF